ncbi:HutD family protein [Nocardia sp. CA-084685]|uniref:HutD family protein n=1 Tax=Nocardia sp. CA-084685 TaxID=3239970 RepID=UPI003D98576C
MLETIRTVARRDRQSVPWFNRHGMTSEIVRGTPTQSGTPSWRLSVASLREDADFSPLRDIDRVFTVVGNVGTTLHFADHDHWAAPLVPYAFAGEDSPFCEITAPTEAFNVMVERTAATASVTSTGDHASRHPQLRRLDNGHLRGERFRMPRPDETHQRRLRDLPRQVRRLPGIGPFAHRRNRLHRRQIEHRTPRNRDSAALTAVGRGECRARDYAEILFLDIQHRFMSAYSNSWVECSAEDGK